MHFFENQLAATVSIEEIGLYDPTPEQAFDKVIDTVITGIGVPVSLLSIVDVPGNRQFFKCLIGLPSPWKEARETPLSHSFCQYVVATDAPLVVTDARQEELLHCNLAIRDLGVISYLGAPVCGPNGKNIGALCAIDTKPRDWTPSEVSSLVSLADGISGRIFSTAAFLAGERQINSAHLQGGAA